MTDAPTVTRNDDENRYEVRVGDELGGFLQFLTSRDGRTVLPHTVVDPAFKGQGLGSILAGEALADLARRGDTVVPRCPFVAHYLEEHEVEGLRVDWPDRHDAS